MWNDKADFSKHFALYLKSLAKIELEISSLAIHWIINFSYQHIVKIEYEYQDEDHC